MKGIGRVIILLGLSVAIVDPTKTNDITILMIRLACVFFMLNAVISFED